ncbi:MAG: hypothetical protein FWC41_13200 [Firmicutes bacterium]|nr:hypothetical protein [Bacillota bacterium]
MKNFIEVIEKPMGFDNQERKVLININQIKRIIDYGDYRLLITEIDELSRVNYRTNHSYEFLKKILCFTEYQTDNFQGD